MIYIIRHGKTEMNRANVLQGRSDLPLNEEGVRQAEAAAEKLRGVAFSHVFTSPLARAVQTARIVAPGTAPIVDDRLTEMDYGPYEGMDLKDPAPELRAFFSDFVHNPAPEGMEPLASVAARVGEFLEEVRHLPGNILISTHAIAMKGALECLTPDSKGGYWSKYIGNCAIYVAENADGRIGVPVELDGAGDAPRSDPARGGYDVALAACDGYGDPAVEAALRSALEPVGGLGFVRPGMRIAVKVNLVTAMKPDSAATVHPSVVCALVKLLRERGAEVVIGDGPGGIYSGAYLRVVYDVCGMRRAEALGAELNDDFSVAEVEYPDAVMAKRFPYTAYLGKADAVIDVCKLKTHGMMGLSCAVKNLFGSVPGTIKPEFHYRYPRAEDFANALVDLYEYTKPRLCICDAVVGMEGNGPTQGTPRRIGCLIVARDGHRLDAVAAGLIGLAPREVPTLRAAVARGLLPADPSEIAVSGDPSRFRVPDFRTVPAQSSVFFHVLGDGLIGRAADLVASRVLTPYPKLNGARCVGCGKCAQVCPAGAVSMRRGKPAIDRRACIHCFCCQEFCPKGAMEVGRTRIMRLLGRGS